MKKKLLKKVVLLIAFVCIGFSQADATIVKIFKGSLVKGTSHYNYVFLFYEKLECLAEEGACGRVLRNEKTDNHLDLSSLFGPIEGTNVEIALFDNIQKQLDNGVYSGRIVSDNGPIPRIGYSETIGKYAQDLLAAGNRGDYEYIEKFNSSFHFAVWNFTFQDGEYNGFVIVN